MFEQILSKVTAKSNDGNSNEREGKEQHLKYWDPKRYIAAR